MARARTRKRSGGYVLDFYLKYPDGRRKRIQKQGFPTLEKRDAERRRLEEEAGKGIDPKAYTVRRLGERFLADRRAAGLESGSVKKYDVAFRIHINPLMGDLPIARLTTSEPVDQLRDALLVRGCSASNARLQLRYFRAVLHWAVKKRYIDRNVAVESELPKVEEEDFVWPTHDEAREVIRLAGAHGRDPELYQSFIHTLAATGLRITEARLMMWEDVDLVRRQLRVRRRNTKTKAGERTISIEDVDVGMLRLLYPRRTKRDGFVFVTKDGGLLPEATMHRVLVSLGTKAKIPFRLHPHMFRHYHASACIEAGMDFKALQKRLGHASIRVTMDVYGHLRDDFDREAATRVSELLMGGRSKPFGDVLVTSELDERFSEPISDSKSGYDGP